MSTTLVIIIIIEANVKIIYKFFSHQHQISVIMSFEQVPSSGGVWPKAWKLTSWCRHQLNLISIWKPLRAVRAGQSIRSAIRYQSGAERNDWLTVLKWKQSEDHFDFFFFRADAQQFPQWGKALNSYLLWTCLNWSQPCNIELGSA